MHASYEDLQQVWDEIRQQVWAVGLSERVRLIEILYEGWDFDHSRGRAVRPLPNTLVRQ